jgi:NADH-quinone oxidoreductase subunit M
VGVILSAVYMLWLYQRTFLGKHNGKQDNGVNVMYDLTVKEWSPLVPLIVMMVWLGSYTSSFMPPITAATEHLLEQSKMNLEIRVRSISPKNAATKEIVKASYAEESHGR